MRHSAIYDFPLAHCAPVRLLYATHVRLHLVALIYYVITSKNLSSAREAELLSSLLLTASYISSQRRRREVGISHIAYSCGIALQGKGKSKK